jgi:RNA polymerase sigma-70 factor (ECF subfamily)
METSAFDDLYSESCERLVAQLWGFTGDEARARDHVQEAFLRAWTHWEQVSDYADPEAWVRRVAFNLAKSHWRRFRNLVLGDVLLDGAAVGESDSVPDLVGALQHLPPRERQALCIFYLADRSLSDVAADMKVPLGTAKSLLSRGRTHLAAAIERTDRQERSSQRG